MNARLTLAQTTLSKKLGISGQWMGELVSRLEREGWVQHSSQKLPDGTNSSTIFRARRLLKRLLVILSKSHRGEKPAKQAAMCRWHFSQARQGACDRGHITEEPCEGITLTYGFEAERRGRPRRLGSDKEDHTIDFLLTPTRDRDAAEAFLRKAIRTQGLPEKIAIDKSGSNTAAIKRYSQTHKTAIVIRHSKYLNNIVEQDHRAVKRLVRPMRGVNSFWAARCTIAGMEVMHAIRKGQLLIPEHVPQTPAEQFYALAA